ncbi:hypothetical protein EF83_22985, partial [Bacillus subtilis]
RTYEKVAGYTVDYIINDCLSWNMQKKQLQMTWKESRLSRKNYGAKSLKIRHFWRGAEFLALIHILRLFVFAEP